MFQFQLLSVFHMGIFSSAKNKKTEAKSKTKTKKQTTVKIKKQQNKELFLNIVF